MSGSRHQAAASVTGNHTLHRARENASALSVGTNL